MHEPNVWAIGWAMRKYPNKLCDGVQQVNHKDEQIAHAANAITPYSRRKTARTR